MGEAESMEKRANPTFCRNFCQAGYSISLNVPSSGFDGIVALVEFFHHEYNRYCHSRQVNSHIPWLLQICTNFIKAVATVFVVLIACIHN